MNTTKLTFNHDYSDEHGHEIELTIRCRLGAAPTLLRELVNQTIEPMARRYDPDWKPVELPVQQPDWARDEEMEPLNLRRTEDNPPDES